MRTERHVLTCEEVSAKVRMERTMISEFGRKQVIEIRPALMTVPFHARAQPTQQHPRAENVPAVATKVTQSHITDGGIVVRFCWSPGSSFLCRNFRRSLSLFFLFRNFLPKFRFRTLRFL